MGVGMSAGPGRSEEEEAAIRARAHELWLAEGILPSRELENWLDAEAALQAEGLISVRPLTLPFRLSFTAVDMPQGMGKLSLRYRHRDVVSAPTGVLTTSFETIDLNVSAEPDSSAPGTPLFGVAHDSRLVAIQSAAIAASLNRIQRLADMFVSLPNPETLWIFEPDPGNQKMFRMKSEYRRALLDPYYSSSEVSKLDGLLSNVLVADGVIFDVQFVSLGSHINFESLIHTKGWKHAFAVAVFLLGFTFLEGYAMKAGPLLAEYQFHRLEMQGPGDAPQSALPGLHGSVVQGDGSNWTNFHGSFRRQATAEALQQP